MASMVLRASRTFSFRPSPQPWPSIPPRTLEPSVRKSRPRGGGHCRKIEGLIHTGCEPLNTSIRTSISSTNKTDRSRRGWTSFLSPLDYSLFPFFLFLRVFWVPVVVFAMNVPLDATGELPEEHKAKLLRAIEAAQVRDSMRLYNSLVERCFGCCVDGFRSKNLDSTEEKCVKRCAEKFLAVSGRVGIRFQEFSAEHEKKQMEQLQKMQRGML